MLRTGLLTIAMIVALQGFCFGQGFLDSLLGPSGLGLWGAAVTLPGSNITTPKCGEVPRGRSSSPTNSLVRPDSNR